MPPPNDGVAAGPAITDRRNRLLVILGMLYGLMLLGYGLLLWSYGKVDLRAIGFLAPLSLGYSFYFLPTLMVCFIRHRDATGIFVLNLFTGWTLVGWLLAFLWAIPPLGKRQQTEPPEGPTEIAP